MKDARITGISTDEFEYVTELWEASVRATHSFLTEDDIIFFKPLVLTKVLPDAEKLFAIRSAGDRIMGFLGIDGNNIEMLFIHPEYFGKGLGKQLIKFALNEHQATRVDVNEQNPSATGFYQHMGFVIKSRSEMDGMGKPFPILHMEWQDVSNLFKEE